MRFFNSIHIKKLKKNVYPFYSEKINMITKFLKKLQKEKEIIAKLLYTIDRNLQISKE